MFSISPFSHLRGHPICLPILNTPQSLLLILCTNQIKQLWKCMIVEGKMKSCQKMIQSRLLFFTCLSKVSGLPGQFLDPRGDGEENSPSHLESRKDNAQCTRNILTNITLQKMIDHIHIWCTDGMVLFQAGDGKATGKTSNQEMTARTGKQLELPLHCWT